MEEGGGKRRQTKDRGNEDRWVWQKVGSQRGHGRESVKEERKKRGGGQREGDRHPRRGADSGKETGREEKGYRGSETEGETTGGRRREEEGYKGREVGGRDGGGGIQRETLHPNIYLTK